MHNAKISKAINTIISMLDFSELNLIIFIYFSLILFTLIIPIVIIQTIRFEHIKTNSLICSILKALINITEAKVSPINICQCYQTRCLFREKAARRMAQGPHCNFTVIGVFLQWAPWSWRFETFHPLIPIDWQS